MQEFEKEQTGNQKLPVYLFAASVQTAIFRLKVSVTVGQGNRK